MSAIDVHDASTAANQHRLDLDQKAALGALLERDQEAWARLCGLIAILSLPPHETRKGVPVDSRACVTVEVTPGVWKNIERVYVSSTAIVVAQGINGHSIGWTFPQPGPVPVWQWHKIEPTTTLDEIRETR